MDGLTESLMTEKSKKQSVYDENFLRDILENANDLIQSVNAEGEFVYVNRKWIDVLGYSEREVKNLKLPDIIRPDYFPKCMEIFKRVLRGEAFNKIETVFLTKDGQEIHVEGNIKPVLHNNRFVSTCGVFRDITERKKREKELEESEKKFREIFENVGDIIVYVDKKGRILNINKRVKDVLGYKPEEIIGKNFARLKVIDVKEMTKLVKLFRRTVREGKVRELVELELKHKNGKKVFVEVSTRFIKKNGKVEGVVNIIRDITEERRTKEELKKSKELFEKIYTCQREAIFILDSKKPPVILDCNPAALEIFGYSKEEMVGRTTEFLHVDEEHLKRFQNELYPAIQRDGFLHLDEFRMRRMDGTVFPSEHTVVPLNDDEGNRIGWVSVVKDITEKKKMEKAQIEFNEILRLINKILRHDILNDLTIVSNSIDMYIETKDRKLLNTAFKSIEKSVNLIKNMRELESLFSIQGSLKPCSIREAINEVIQNYPVDFEIDGDCSVVADEALNSVIDNILRNAMKHGNADKINIKIENKGKYCEIRIADNGTGIPDEIKNKIFDEGFSYGEHKGSGLGLYIVKKTVERYKGKLHIENNHPTGTIFVLKLLTSDLD